MARVYVLNTEDHCICDGSPAKSTLPMRRDPEENLSDDFFRTNRGRPRRGSRHGALGARAPPTQWACLEKLDINYKDVINVFARKHPRINILDSDG